MAAHGILGRRDVAQEWRRRQSAERGAAVAADYRATQHRSDGQGGLQGASLRQAIGGHDSLGDEYARCAVK